MALKTSEEIEREAQSFQVLTFVDVLRALKEHPDWLEEVRKIILTHELLEVPRKLDELIKEFRELKERVIKLEQDVGELKQDVEVLKQDVEVLKQDVVILKQEVATLKEDVETLKKDMKYVKGELGRLKGMEFERRVREKFYAYFGRLLRKAKLIEDKELVSLLEEAEEQGKISEEQFDELLRLDLVIEGRIKATNKEVVLAVEASYSIFEEDIERAVSRANLLSYILGKEVIPTVVGVEVREEVEALAEERGVFLIKVSE